MDHTVLTVEGDRQRIADRLFLDDLHIGQRFTSKSHVVDAGQIKRFAAEFDPQPFHLDEDAAANSLFGGLAASGWHTTALTMRLLVTSGAPIAGGIVGAGAEIAFPKPTRPGDELQVVSEVTEITPSRTKPDRGIAVLRSETRNQRGEVVLVLTAKRCDRPDHGAGLSFSIPSCWTRRPTRHGIPLGSRPMGLVASG